MNGSIKRIYLASAAAPAELLKQVAYR